MAGFADDRVIGSAIGNRREAIEALEFAARGLVKCHIKIEKLENLSKVSLYTGR